MNVNYINNYTTPNLNDKIKNRQDQKSKDEVKRTEGH